MASFHIPGVKKLGQLYETACLPYLVDIACGVNVIARQRDKVVPKARGKVLEIGMGTGLNLRHYDSTKVVQLVGIDPGIAHGKVQKRIQRSELPVTLVDLSAETLPFDDGEFDSVVVTYSLCTIPDAVAALREMRRVLKADGRLLYCEHGLSPDTGVQRWQHRLNPAWKKVAGGCNLDRDIPALLEQAGFILQQPAKGYVPGPKILSYQYWGEGVKKV